MKSTVVQWTGEKLIPVGTKAAERFEKLAAASEEISFNKFAFSLVGAELHKLAHSLEKVAILALPAAGTRLNVGQWWDEVGGPFLAGGGSLKEFKQKMGAAGISEKQQTRFMKAAKERYSDVRTKSDTSFRRVGAALALSAVPALGGIAYTAGADQKVDPLKGPEKWQAQLGRGASWASKWGTFGALIGASVGMRKKGIHTTDRELLPALLTGAATLGTLGGAAGLMSVSDEHALRKARKAFNSKRPEAAERRLRRAAQKSVANLAKEDLGYNILAPAMVFSHAPQLIPAAIGLSVLEELGSRVPERYENVIAYQKLKELQAKANAKMNKAAMDKAASYAEEMAKSEAVGRDVGSIVGAVAGALGGGISGYRWAGPWGVGLRGGLGTLVGSSLGAAIGGSEGRTAAGIKKRSMDKAAMDKTSIGFIGRLAGAAAKGGAKRMGLLGAGVGAAGGAITAKPGSRLSGALGGALKGGALGAVGGGAVGGALGARVGHKITKLMPAQQTRVMKQMGLGR